MFLFSTPARPAEPQAVDNPVARSVKAAAEATGTSFDYLMRTAKRESNLNPAAKAPTSSATGLFQFIEQTWLGLVKKEGPNLGLKAEAEAIQQDGAGRYSIAEPSARRQILEMRKDPELSSRLAGVFTQKNRDTLRESIGREPNAGELYMAHFLGARGASELISLSEQRPAESAARAFPEAAAANRSIFFDQRGGSRSVREVYHRLAAFHTGVDPTNAVGVAQARPATATEELGARSPLALAPARISTATGTEKPMHGLFRTPTGGEGPAPTAFRRGWNGFAEARLNKDAPSFFPRSEPVKVASIDPAAVATDAANTTLSDAPASPPAGFEADLPPVPIAAPLPPVRPRDLGRKPLDLTRHAKAGR